ncbi:hypothetical protein M3N55_10515 [Roseibaca sp. V10]|uniref:Uncharacterized protein n=1 Tax=Roseinatronobacter domitianus TaxID=2940293 RepID=A0ABT0M2T7_9RHOB|nr:hypothetical protein [Roseibaca domitiana]MCL1629165.1 hypothetical protein [Roseibaca domitiana]
MQDDLDRLGMHSHRLAVRVGNLPGIVEMSDQKGFAQEMWPTLRNFLSMMRFHHQNDIALLPDFSIELTGRMVVQRNPAGLRRSGAVGIYPAPDKSMKPGGRHLCLALRRAVKRSTNGRFGNRRAADISGADG